MGIVIAFASAFLGKSYRYVFFYSFISSIIVSVYFYSSTMYSARVLQQPISNSIYILGGALAAIRNSTFALFIAYIRKKFHKDKKDSEVKNISSLTAVITIIFIVIISIIPSHLLLYLYR